MSSIDMDEPAQSSASSVLLLVVAADERIVDVNHPDASEATVTVIAMRRMDANKGDMPFILFYCIQVVYINIFGLNPEVQQRARGFLGAQGTAVPSAFPQEYDIITFL